VDNTEDALGASAGIPFASDDVTVSVAGTAERGGDLVVTITYTGDRPTADGYGFVALFPGENPQTALASLGGNFGGAVAEATSATVFTATVHVPEHWKEGNYTIVAFITNHGAADNLADEFQEGGFETVEVVAPGAGPDGTDGDGTEGGGLLPGFESVAALVAVAAAAFALAGRRRSRSG
jgi:hypothetical protein